MVIDMNEIDSSKYASIINRKNKKTKSSNIKKYLFELSLRTLAVFLILLSLAIVYKKDNNFKENISLYFFEENISFTKIKKIYDKYLGGLLLTKREENTMEVFNEKLNYSTSSIYHDGVKLSVSESYLVPTLDEGMVVFIGNKDNYGKTIIIENLDGIHYWYGNINNTSLKLYDYVERGTLIGDVNNELYMIFSKDGKFLDYEEYIN